MLSFVHDDGKGFVATHSAIDAFYNWPEYGEMMGAYFDNHPWGVMDPPIIVEEPGFPAMKHLPKEFIMRDEIYVLKSAPYSRKNVDVLARLDANKIDLKLPELHRIDKDFPVAWVKNYGKGRVSTAPWDISTIVGMTHESNRYTLRPSNGRLVYRTTYHTHTRRDNPYWPQIGPELAPNWPHAGPRHHAA